MRGRIYLTVDRKKRDGSHIAILTDGHPEFKDDPVTVLSVTTVRNMVEARAWRKLMMETKPWLRRQ